MKKLFNLLIFLISINSYSQSVNNQIDKQSTVTHPVYKGCEKAKDSKKCFSKKINLHFTNKLRFSKFQNLTPGLKRVFIIFQINETGGIDSVKIRAPHKIIELETKRVLHLIPKFIPGFQNNQPIAVKYSLPLVFKVEKKKPISSRKTPWNQNKIRKF